MTRRHGTPKPGWHWDQDWRQRRLMDWLTTPPVERDPPTKGGLAELLGVDVRTLREWQEHPQFREAWDQRVTQIVGDPARAQAVIDTLYRAATDENNRSHVQAAKLYLEATHAIKPPAIEVTVKRPAELTDEELDALLASGAAELRSEAAELRGERSEQSADATD